MFSLKSELKSGQIIVTCMVLKATANDSRHLALCNEELRRPQSGLCRLDDISNNNSKRLSLTTDKRCGRSIVHLKKENNRSVFSPEEPENTKKELQTDSHQRGYVTGETPIDNNNTKLSRDWGDDILSSWLFGSRDRTDMWSHLLWSRGV
ncbi:hypothetical protein TNCV_5067461 [Trichonephila clavipes]|nr:hypothetical protein TNCV_5067461 [Trichonephila clavipes]